MILKTICGTLTPDGHLTVSKDDLPLEPVSVMVTLLPRSAETFLSEVGDYRASLCDYEERLARGEIKWQ